MNRDCFGYRRSPMLGETCACLETMVCKERKCSFYKSREQFRDDLIRIHGTCDQKEIGARYALGKEKKDETV